MNIYLDRFPDMLCMHVFFLWWVFVGNISYVIIEVHCGDGEPGGCSQLWSKQPSWIGNRMAMVSVAVYF
jgi:hypothetical protein